MARVKQQHVTSAKIENVLNSRAWCVHCGGLSLSLRIDMCMGGGTVDNCCILLAFYAVSFEVDIEAHV